MLNSLITLAQSESLTAHWHADAPVQCYRKAFVQYYLPGAPVVPLLALLVVAGDRRWLSVFAADAHTESALIGLESPAQALAWLAQRQLAVFDPDQPLALAPVVIAKPWGREVWFTGIEARGQSAFADSQGWQCPMPWLLSFLPDWLAAGGERTITLLKILDPLPEPVYGDLYFELHEQKQEVYVVTRVDPHCWPGGQGGIRFGFDQQRRREYGSDEAFKAAYLLCVQRYQAVRRQIDQLLDDRRRQAGIGLNEPVSAAQSQRWLATLPAELINDEIAARAELDSFAALMPLSVGDVVKVPCLTPHSLLHGVTTVEFQTPVYERKILSFAQKVLTQDHWDTEAALAQVNLSAPDNPPLVCLFQAQGVKRERVVAFDDFEVERISLQPGAQLTLEEPAYAVLIAVTAGVLLESDPLAPEAACFIPAARACFRLANGGAGEAVLLLSRPVWPQ